MENTIQRRTPSLMSFLPVVIGTRKPCERLGMVADPYRETARILSCRRHEGLTGLHASQSISLIRSRQARPGYDLRWSLVTKALLDGNIGVASPREREEYP